MSRARTSAPTAVPSLKHGVRGWIVRWWQTTRGSLRQRYWCATEAEAVAVRDALRSGATLNEALLAWQGPGDARPPASRQIGPGVVLWCVACGRPIVVRGDVPSACPRCFQARWTTRAAHPDPVAR